MFLCFELSMPGRGSWDGKWSGEAKRHLIIRNIGHSESALDRGQRIIAGAPYRHDFGDGWIARVDVREVEGREAIKLRRESAGFAGFDWMVSSICADRTITPPSDTAWVRKHLMAACLEAGQKPGAKAMRHIIDVASGLIARDHRRRIEKAREQVRSSMSGGTRDNN